MSTPMGQFVWYDLMTPDPKAAQRFYADVVGWEMKPYGDGEHYTLLQIGETGVGGIMALSQESAAAGTPPCWIGYVMVDDVDAYCAKVFDAGGAVHKPPADIPEVGRFAVVADPQGAAFMLFAPLPRPTPPHLPTGAPGTMGWRELMTTNWEAAFGFYSGLFGWKKEMAVEMGEHGVYQVFSYGQGQAQDGGMMNKPSHVQAPPFWGYYIQVDGLGAAIERVKAGGGQVLNGPLEVPGGQWIINARDPQGAFFNLLSRNP